jgi:hypothetical protein
MPQAGSGGILPAFPLTMYHPRDRAIREQYP